MGIAGRGSRRWLGRAVGMLALVVLPGIGLSLASAFATPPCTDFAPGDMAGQAFVLSAGTLADGRPDHASTKRTEAAIGLFEAGVVDRMLFTGDALKPEGYSTAGQMAAYAAGRGIPRDRIVIEPRSKSTLQNMMLSAPLLADGPRVIMVTSGFHLWRARASAAWAGVAIDSQCRAGRFDQRTWTNRVHAVALEGIKWPMNALRAGLWSAAGALGLQRHLPGWILA